MVNDPYKIIGIVLIKNEDVFIERALINILEFCDRIIVADNCSTDRTSEILNRLASRNDKIDYHRIKSMSVSHDLIKDFAGKRSWIFAVDGDEIYDPAGLLEFRKELLSGIYDAWWVIFGNVLNCTELDVGRGVAGGYLAPPCRSMTKLYNFGLIESWSESSGERLHGGDAIFRSGFDKSLRLNLHEEYSWKDARFRCLHMCFLQRSSLQKAGRGGIVPRPNPADIMSRNFVQRFAVRIQRLFGIPERGKTEWKIEKFTRGEIVEKNVSVFFPPLIDEKN